jgi:hypothetical protein
MSEHLPVTGTYHLREKLTIRERFMENRAAVGVYCLIFGMCTIFAFLAGIFSPFVYAAFGFGLLSFLVFLFGGVLVGLGTVGAMTLIGRIKNRGSMKLSAIEQRLRDGTSTDVWQDLQTLVDGNLKLKRLQVADFYSHRLFELSHGATKLSDVMLSTECWANTKEYQKSLKYWIFWIFQSRGTLCLSSKSLQYTSKKISFEIPLDDIIKLSLATHPRWLKPIPLNYIVVHCLLDGQPSEVYLTPSKSQADNIWQVNDMIKTWFAHISKAKEDQIKRVAMSTEAESNQLTDTLPHQLSA